jgi:hypothetical protein
MADLAPIVRTGSEPRASAADLTIRFLGGPPSEEVVHFARRCMARAGVRGPTTLVLQWGRGGRKLGGEVRLELPSGAAVSERDPDVLLAIRNACERAAVAASAPFAEPVHA